MENLSPGRYFTTLDELGVKRNRVRSGSNPGRKSGDTLRVSIKYRMYPRSERAGSVPSAAYEKHSTHPQGKKNHRSRLRNYRRNRVESEKDVVGEVPERCRPECRAVVFDKERIAGATHRGRIEHGHSQVHSR